MSQQNVRREFCVIWFYKKPNVKKRLHAGRFFIFHFSFKVVPLHPNSENPMHSTTAAPVIEAQFRPKDVIRNF